LPVQLQADSFEIRLDTQERTKLGVPARQALCQGECLPDRRSQPRDEFGCQDEIDEERDWNAALDSLAPLWYNGLAEAAQHVVECLALNTNYGRCRCRRDRAQNIPSGKDI
jgi:hypothetical protein